MTMDTDDGGLTRFIDKTYDRADRGHGQGLRGLMDEISDMIGMDRVSV